MKASRFLSKKEEQEVVAAIMEAEKATSGEVRVHIESVCDIDPKLRAQYNFEKLGMTKTAARNGVLVYVACESRKFAVIGDEGINNVVPKDFWKDVVAAMGECFSRGEFAAGLSKGILMIGEKLKAFFPYQTDDENELSDEISYGDSKDNAE